MFMVLQLHLTLKSNPPSWGQGRGQLLQLKYPDGCWKEQRSLVEDCFGRRPWRVNNFMKFVMWQRKWFNCRMWLKQYHHWYVRIPLLPHLFTFVGSSSQSVSACSADYRHIKMSPDRRQRPECGGLESAVGFLAQPPLSRRPIPAASVSFAGGSHPARVRRILPDIDALMCAPLSRLWLQDCVSQSRAAVEPTPASQLIAAFGR